MDYICLHVAYNHGGIYLDTDVNVLQSLGQFLEHRAFLRWESLKALESFLIGTEAEHLWIAELLEDYNGCGLVIIANARMYTREAKGYGLEHDETIPQVLQSGVRIYPQKFLCFRNYRWRSRMPILFITFMERI